MITFITAILLLVIGYFVYGKIVERYLDVDPSRKTPAYERLTGLILLRFRLGKSS